MNVLYSESSPLRIVWRHPINGSLSVTTIVSPPLDGETEQEHVSRIAAITQAKDPSMAGYQQVGTIHRDNLPGRKFRNCWQFIAGTVAVDVILARQQVVSEVRRERNQKLTVSDGEMLRRIERGTAEQQAAYRQYRQRLRDVPAVVTAELELLATARQLEDYRPVWPAETD